MSRATRATIDAGALAGNLAAVRARAPGTRVMAVVKANAYGHGITAAVRALGAADAFAVACIDEALAVRAAGSARPVVLLEGAHASEDLALAAREGFEVVVHDAAQLDYLRVHAGPPLRCWLKIDTGMHRLGFAPEDARAAHAALAALPGVASLALMTHLASSDDRGGHATRRQLAAFAAFADLPGPRSIANSAGALGTRETQADWIRPGLALYGVSPFADDLGRDHGLAAAMTVSTRLLSVKTVRMGEGVGYGARSTAPEDMPVGIAAIGYGDGYPRHAPPGTPVLVAGRRAPLLGRVSMDMIAVDLRGVPTARTGDPVELWGAGLPVEEVARAAGMIPYELLCGVTQRVRHEVV